MSKVIQIQLTGDFKGVLDVATNEAVPVVFAVSDLRDPSKKTGVTSRVIKLADTVNNHNTLAFLFDITTVVTNLDVSYTKAMTCVLLEDGIAVMDNAVMQLTKVVKSNPTTATEQGISYECIVKDLTAEFFANLGTKELTDLKLDDLNHGYSSANVVDSFGNTQADGFKYLMPLISGNVFNLQDFRPAIYAKTYFDRIFASAGFSYQWDELTNIHTRFDKLVIPYNGDVPKLSETVRQSYLVEASKTSPQQVTSLAVDGYPKNIAPFKVTIPNEITDGASIYNPATSVYTSPVYTLAGGSVDFELVVEWRLELINNSGGTAYPNNFQLDYTPRMYLGSGGLLSNVANANLKQSNNGKIVFRNGVESLATGATTIGSGVSTVYLSGGLTALGTTFEIGAGVQSYATATTRWRDSVDIFSPGNEVEIDTKLTISNVYMRVLPSMSEIGFSQTIYMNDFVPKKIKQSEFIKSIFTLYNIIAEVDTFNSNKLILKSRDKYYDDGKEVDWTQKRSKERENEIQFLPSVQNKKFKLSYKQDTDSPNVDYESATNEIYGQIEFTFDSEHVKDTEVKELIFSPTPVAVNDFGAVVPMLSGVAPKTNIRLLYDGDETECLTFTIVDYMNGTTPVGTTSVYYPLMSHFDKPNNPTFDLNFGVCDYYYYQIGTKTNNNFFNLKWRRTLSQMNEGNLFTAYFNLNILDITKLKLSDKIQVENEYFHINKLEYNPSGNGVTKVELMTVDSEVNLISFPVPAEPPGQPMPSDVVTTTTGKVIKQTYEASNVVQTSSPIEIQGVNNNVSSSVKSGKILGNGNVVKENNTITIGDNKNVEKEGMSIEKVTTEEIESTTANIGRVNALAIYIDGINIYDIFQTI